MSLEISASPFARPQYPWRLRFAQLAAEYDIRFDVTSLLESTVELAIKETSLDAFAPILSIANPLATIEAPQTGTLCIEPVRCSDGSRKAVAVSKGHSRRAAYLISPTPGDTKCALVLRRLQSARRVRTFVVSDAWQR